ncbi:uncharacterized protein KGF55_000967 [Candida pseudojiufengensis]|uniref:uncharacterized protein n=1 Tax=Candida pseudojiufengensis TaxID=497109 RepID=UPI00222594E4|nr:uncharacterized protein KGF55_000967 [Candida pseudojiufengensis]KAI5965605.1 hypothetical protein KGF55_000967 [Candida pseudojiufengensis]
MHFHTNLERSRPYNHKYRSTILLSQFKSIIIFILIFLLPTLTSAIGLNISPIKNTNSNQKKLSSLKNLQNCLSYETGQNDIIFLTINPIENLISQELNLKIIDSRGNILRNQHNLSKFNKMLELIINPNNNEVTSTIASEENNGEIDIRSNADTTQKERNFIHICFDNLYNDLSWSFQPKKYEIEIDINIKNDIKLTNYKIFKNYFSNFDNNHINQEENQQQQQPQEGSNSEFYKIQLNEELFDSKMSEISIELNNIQNKLIENDAILQDLLNQEFKLRDVNEEIFGSYNFISIFLCCFIFGCGILQLIIFKFTLKKKNIT